MTELNKRETNIFHTSRVGTWVDLKSYTSHLHSKLQFLMHKVEKMLPNVLPTYHIKYMCIKHFILFDLHTNSVRCNMVDHINSEQKVEKSALNCTGPS